MSSVQYPRLVKFDGGRYGVQVSKYSFADSDTPLRWGWENAASSFKWINMSLERAEEVLHILENKTVEGYIPVDLENEKALNKKQGFFSRLFGRGSSY